MDPYVLDCFENPKMKRIIYILKAKSSKKIRNQEYCSKWVLLFQKIWCYKIHLFFFARYISWFERENKSKSKVHTQRNTCFSSKSILRCIRAKDIKTQNQIDMAEMGVKGRYRYILTAEGALNLFVWLCRPKDKSSPLVHK